MKNKSVWMIIPNLLRSLFRKDVSLKSKLLLFAGLIYVVSPIDLLPDILVGLGWLDDLVIVALMGWLSYRSLPGGVQREVVSGDAEGRATPHRLFIYLGILVIVGIVIAITGGSEPN